jgi:nucleotide-binding universal stress UspA family protein
MKIILVPTDFSPAAKNAATYAIELAKQVGVIKVILYNAYQVPVTIDPAMPVMQLVNMEELKGISETGLTNLKEELSVKFQDEIVIETLGEFAVLPVNIDDACERTGANLIVMGITGSGGSFEDVFIGSNTISVVNHTKNPVLIVPSNVSFKPVKKLLLVCDFKKVGETTPVHPLKSILRDIEAKLLVLNVSSTNIEGDPAMLEQKEILDNLLKGYNPEYHFINSDNFADSINEFTVVNMVDMIITIPKKHGFFDNIFRKSHTKQLAFHTHVPLMCIHEEEH